MKQLDTIHGENIASGEMKSSIRQFENTLSRFEKSEFLPLVYDKVLGYDKDGNIISEPRILTDDNQRTDYHYEVKELQKTEHKYIERDVFGRKTKNLDERYGEGQYDEYVDEKRGVNDNYQGLSATTETTLRVGTPYFSACETVTGENI